MILTSRSYALFDCHRSTNESLSDGLLEGLSGSRFVCDVEVGTQADETGLAGRCEHAFSGEGVQELLRPLDLDEHDVGLRRIYRVAGLAQPVGQSLRPLVVFFEPANVVLEGVEGGGGDHTRLPHAAAERLAGPARLPDGLLVPGEQRRVGKECRSRWSPYH